MSYIEGVRGENHGIEVRRIEIRMSSIYDMKRHIRCGDIQVRKGMPGMLSENLVDRFQSMAERGPMIVNILLYDLVSEAAMY